MNKTIGNTHVLVLAVVALAVAFFLLGHIPPRHVQVHANKADGRTALFTATQVFGLAQGQKARFCIGTVTSRGPALDWVIPISDERGTVLLQLPETHSPEGQWRCIEVPRGSLPVSGEPITGRVQVAARHLVKAPAGTQASQIVGSFEIINSDGTTGGAVAGVLYAAFHNND